MNVVAISGRYADAAAAVSVDGSVVAAASEEAFVRVPHVGYHRTGGFPTLAVEACLAKAGLDAEAIDHVAVVEAELLLPGPDRRQELGVALAAFRSRPTEGTPVDALLADAWQATASAPADAVLVCSPEPQVVTTFVRDGSRLVPETPGIEGGAELQTAARLLADSLGLHASIADPVGALDRLSIGGEPEYLDAMPGCIVWCDPGAVTVDVACLAEVIRAAGSWPAEELANSRSLNVRVQHARRALAASFMCQVARVLGDASDRLAARTGASRVALGGATFGHARLNTELRQRFGDDVVRATVPEPAGRAIGAAIAASGGGFAGLDDLALGPAFSPSDVKATLDNCRLDYLYEPDWPRLLGRVSRMLSQGKVVAWFQGGMGFGPRAAGTRSILCDPSGRYARQNMNEYLRRMPLDEPLPVVFASSKAAECLERPVSGPLAVVDAAVRPAWRDRLAGALDWRQHVRVHAAAGPQAPALRELLELHAERTGVPALIEVNLSAPGESIACTPRDAIRVVYSSAIDALVIDRFVLMKDHWLLRADGDQ